MSTINSVRLTAWREMTFTGDGRKMQVLGGGAIAIQVSMLKSPDFKTTTGVVIAAGFASKQSAKNPLCTNCTLDLSRFIRSSTS